ncbi:MAG: hypothetical protein WKG01_05555 [Kofleriaceae bacterium]
MTGIVAVRTAGRGVHGVVPPSWTTPMLNTSLMPYQIDGASEIGSPTAPDDMPMFSVEPAIKILPAPIDSGGSAPAGATASASGDDSGTAFGSVVVVLSVVVSTVAPASPLTSVPVPSAGGSADWAIAVALEATTRDAVNNIFDKRFI